MRYAQVKEGGKLHKLMDLRSEHNPQGWLSCGSAKVPPTAKLFKALDDAGDIPYCIKCFPREHARRLNREFFAKLRKGVI